MGKVAAISFGHCCRLSCCRRWSGLMPVEPSGKNAFRSEEGGRCDGDLPLGG